jgi:autotransporter-associated beta strand protein
MNHATINFTGQGGTKWVGMANDAYGIVGAYVTAEMQWATLDGNGRAQPLPLQKYATNINTAGSTDHVMLIGGGTTALAASGQRATLSFNNISGSTGMLDVGVGQTLTLADGGIVSAGTTAGQIQNGTLRAGATGELVVIDQSPFTISSSIGESVAGTAFTKSGTGTLTLSGVNTYSGVTAINQGTLSVSSDANLGTGSTIEFAGGTLRATQSFSSTKSFTNPIPQIGIVDTGNFNLTFAGVSSGAISKTGTGTLTLTNPAPGTVYIQQGTLLLSNPTSGGMTLEGGTLVSGGTLSSLSFQSPNSFLDIGGAAATTLTTEQLSHPFTGSNETLTVHFGLGLSGSDLWTIVSSSVFDFGSPTAIFLFDFQNLGGVTAGQDYTLMNVQFGGVSLSSSMFAFAPSALSAGWNGIFNVTPTTVSVHLTATPAPEPSSVLLLALGTLGLCSRRRRRLAD